MSEPLPFPPPPWRAYLQGLPEAEPPPAVWLGLQAARAAAQRRRRRVAGLGVAAAAALVLAIALPSALRPPTPAPVPSRVVVAPAPAAVDPGLRRLDDEIAAAVARSAGDEELAVLWQARAQMLADLDGPAPVVLARM